MRSIARWVCGSVGLWVCGSVGLWVCGSVVAQEYSMRWSSIDGGGGRSTAQPDVDLLGVIGQPDAGVSTGGGYTLFGGFLPLSPPSAVAGDCDADGDADLNDYTFFQGTCFTGPQEAPDFPGLDPQCGCADMDHDGDVDLLDGRLFQAAFGR